MPVYFFWAAVWCLPQPRHSITKNALEILKPPTDLSKFKTIAGILFLGGWEMAVTATPQQLSYT